MSEGGFIYSSLGGPCAREFSDHVYQELLLILRVLDGALVLEETICITNGFELQPRTLCTLDVYRSS